MERYCLTGQSPQLVVEPTEKEEYAKKEPALFEIEVS
jgi:hypothetical protein